MLLLLFDLMAIGLIDDDGQNTNYYEKKNIFCCLL